MNTWLPDRLLSFPRFAVRIHMVLCMYEHRRSSTKPRAIHTDRQVSLRAKRGNLLPLWRNIRLYM